MVLVFSNFYAKDLVVKLKSLQEWNIYGMGVYGFWWDADKCDPSETIGVFRIAMYYFLLFFLKMLSANKHFSPKYGLAVVDLESMVYRSSSNIPVPMDIKTNQILTFLERKFLLGVFLISLEIWSLRINLPVVVLSLMKGSKCAFNAWVVL